jgi:hypothetical protein
LEPQDPKPASRASSGRPTPQLALKFGSTLRAENLQTPRFCSFSARTKGLLFPPQLPEIRKVQKKVIKRGNQNEIRKEKSAINKTRKITLP